MQDPPAAVRTCKMSDAEMQHCDTTSEDEEGISVHGDTTTDDEAEEGISVHGDTTTNEEGISVHGDTTTDDEAEEGISVHGDTTEDEQPQEPDTDEQMALTDVPTYLFTKVPKTVHPPVLKVVNMRARTKLLADVFVVYGALVYNKDYITMRISKIVDIVDGKVNIDVEDESPHVRDAGIANAIRHFATRVTDILQTDFRTALRNIAEYARTEQMPASLLNDDKEAELVADGDDISPDNKELFQPFIKKLRVLLWRELKKHAGKTQKLNVWDTCLVPELYKQMAQARQQAQQAHQEAQQAHQEAQQARWELDHFRGSEKDQLMQRIAGQADRIRQLEAQVQTAKQAARDAAADREVVLNADGDVGELTAAVAAAREAEAAARMEADDLRKRQLHVTELVAAAISHYADKLPAKEKEGGEEPPSKKPKTKQTAEDIDLPAARIALRASVQFLEGVAGALVNLQHVAEVDENFKKKPARIVQCHPDQRVAARERDPTGTEDTYNTVYASMQEVELAQKRLALIGRPLPARENLRGR